MNDNKTRFEGVVVGFESPEGYSDPALYIQGSIDGRETAFYLLVSRDVYEKYVVGGVGKMISGVGIIVSDNPLIIRMVGIDE